MKRAFLPVLTLAVVLLITTGTFAKEKMSGRTALTDNSIESLLIGVESENTGLKTSSASILGEYKNSKAVIPLMRELKDNMDERARIQAAIALWQIGDERGIYTIRQAIKFDKSQRVKRICSILFLDTIDPSKTRF